LKREEDSARLLVIRLRDGKLIRSWPLPAADTLEFESAYGKLAVYVVGIALHVMNLEDGRDVALMFPQQVGETHARLVAGGLFYSHGRAYAARTGQLGFIPRSRLVELDAVKAREWRQPLHIPRLSATSPLSDAGQRGGFA